jgi:hypothetical protein
MRRFPLAFPLVAVTLLIVPLMKAQTPDQKSLPTTKKWFFGMQSQMPTHWPKVPVYSMRLHDTHTGWVYLNPKPGVYDWTVLDHWIAAAQANHSPLLYTFSQTPQWASSNPDDQTCSYGPGQCAPPNDLNADGTGPNQHWRDFITALATHAAGPTKVRYWEMWNEPAMPGYWTGTPAQLVRMAKDAREIILSIDPTAKMVSPPDLYNGDFFKKAWKAYADAGGLNYADILAVHGSVRKYPPQCGVYPEASDFVQMMQDFHAFVAQYGMSNKPIWDTEADWGKTEQDCFNDPDLQVAFMAQLYMFHRSEHVRRFYWYQYDNLHALVDMQTGDLTKAGTAYMQIHDWLFETQMNSNCSANGTVWTCGLIADKGYSANVIWDTSQTCKDGHCQTINYKVDSKFAQYHDLNGKTFSITNNEVPIGSKPILVENKSR